MRVRSSNTDSGKTFLPSKMSRCRLRHTQPLIYSVPRIKRPERDIRHSFQSSAEVRNYWSYRPTSSPPSPICPKGRGEGHLYISMYFKVHIIHRSKQFCRTRLSQYARDKMISSVESVGKYRLRYGFYSFENCHTYFQTRQAMYV